MRLKKDPPAGACVGCPYPEEEGSLFFTNKRLCFYLCWKKAVDHRRRENRVC